MAVVGEIKFYFMVVIGRKHCVANVTLLIEYREQMHKYSRISTILLAI